LFPFPGIPLSRKREKNNKIVAVGGRFSLTRAGNATKTSSADKKTELVVVVVVVTMREPGHSDAATDTTNNDGFK
jgi:hypothetical protein